MLPKPVAQCAWLAFYELPLHSLACKQGELSANTIRAFRQRLQPVVGQVIDELSMLTPQQNDQSGYRCKEGSV